MSPASDSNVTVLMVTLATDVKIIYVRMKIVVLVSVVLTRKQLMGFVAIVMNTMLAKDAIRYHVLRVIFVVMKAVNV